MHFEVMEEKNNLQLKYDEMYEMFHETEKVVNRKIAKVDHSLHMKEEEVMIYSWEISRHGARAPLLDNDA